MDKAYGEINPQNRSNRDGMSEDRLSGVLVMRVCFLFVCVCSLQR